MCFLRSAQSAPFGKKHFRTRLCREQVEINQHSGVMLPSVRFQDGRPRFNSLAESSQQL